MRRVSPPRAWVWYAIVAAVLLLPFAVAWPLGGLDHVDDRPPRITIGQRAKGHRVDFVPRKASYATKDPSPSYGEPEPGRFVVLDLDIANVSALPADLTSIFLDLQVRLDGRELDPIMDQHDKVIVRDKDADMLQPGMPEQVRFVWVVPEGAPDPSRIAVAFRDEEYQPSWSLLGYSSGTSLWYKQDIMATFETGLERA